MKTNTIRTAVISIVTIAVIAVGTNAFAGKGYRDDNRRGYGRGYNCPYADENARLTDEQREQLDNEREAFFNATKALRQDLYAKQMELRAELAKKDPDVTRASALQKEVSNLNASLSQKHLEHIIAVRKINPDAGRGFFGSGRGMGYHGMGYGAGMGYGPGYCQQ